MHLSLEELLAVRDGDGTVESARHAASCRECTAEIERLRAVQRGLAALPASLPAQDLWPALREAVKAARHHRRWAGAGWAAAGFAAVFTLAIGVRGGLEAWHEARLLRETKGLVAESQRLEQELRAVDTGGRVVSGRTAGTIVELENRIAVIDTQLARARSERYASQDVVNLWHERVQLLDALVSFQAAGNRYVGL